MAVYHFHAKYKDAHEFTCSVDGLVDRDGEPSPNSGWLEELRDTLAESFGEGVRVESVQILSLTRISG